MRNTRIIIVLISALVVVALGVAIVHFLTSKKPVTDHVPVHPPAPMTTEVQPTLIMTTEARSSSPVLKKARESLISSQFQNALEAGRTVLNKDPDNDEAAFITFLSARMQNLPPSQWQHLLKHVKSAHPLAGLEHSNARVQRYTLWYLKQFDIPPGNKDVQDMVVELYNNSQAYRKVRLDAGSTLASWGKNEFIQLLLKDLANERTRYRAYMSLKSIPDSFLPELSAMNQNLDPRLTAYTTCLLFILGKPSFLREMIVNAPGTLANVEDYVIPTEHPDFIKIAVSLGETAAAFGRKLLTHRSYLVRAAGASILGSIGNEEDASLLLQQLGQESGFHFVQGNIVEALGKLNWKPAVPPLILLVGARAPYLRERVILSLVKLSNEENREKLEELLASNDQRVREGMERILGIIDSQKNKQKNELSKD